MQQFDFMDPTGIARDAPFQFMPQLRSQSPNDFLRTIAPNYSSPMGNTRELAPAVNPLAGVGALSAYGAMDQGYGTAGVGAGAGAAGGGGMLDWLKAFPGSEWGKTILGSKSANGETTMGLGGLAVGGVSALSNLYMGMKQYGLMKDQLSFAKSSFNKNWEAQKTTTNSQLEDRQAARVASNAGAYESVGSYMKKNGIKG